MTWTAQAEALAAEVTELGTEAARLNGAIWAAGVDPQATANLIAAALALGANQLDLFPKADIVPTDREMLEHITSLDNDVALLLRSAQILIHEVSTERERLWRALTTTTQRQVGDGQDHGAGIEAIRMQLADCDAALEILGEVAGQLSWALTRLGFAPEDLATVYEAPYDHLRHGGVLPHRGDFLTGAPA